MRSLAFTVFGDPVPQGSKRAFVVKNRAVVVDDNKASLRTWRSAVVAAARGALDADAITGPIAGPVKVSVFFYLRQPKRPKHGLPATRPDGDKLERAILDALTAAGVVRDDGQVTSMSWRKRYATQTPRAEVFVNEEGR